MNVLDEVISKKKKELESSMVIIIVAGQSFVVLIVSAREMFHLFYGTELKSRNFLFLFSRTDELNPADRTCSLQRITFLPAAADVAPHNYNSLHLLLMFAL